MALFFLIVAGFIGATAALDAGPDGNYTGSCTLHPSKYKDHAIMCIPDHVQAFKTNDRFLVTYYQDPRITSVPLDILDSTVSWDIALWSANFELLFLARFYQNQIHQMSNPTRWASGEYQFRTHKTVPFPMQKGKNLQVFLVNTKDGIAMHYHYALMPLDKTAKPFVVFPHQTPRPDSDYKYFSVSKPSKIAPRTFTVHYADDVFAGPDGKYRYQWDEEIHYSDKPASFVRK